MKHGIHAVGDAIQAWSCTEISEAHFGAGVAQRRCSVGLASKYPDLVRVR
jgi:hypothetical protein